MATTVRIDRNVSDLIVLHIIREHRPSLVRTQPSLVTRVARVCVVLFAL